MLSILYSRNSGVCFSYLKNTEAKVYVLKALLFLIYVEDLSQYANLRLFILGPADDTLLNYQNLKISIKLNTSVFALNWFPRHVLNNNPYIYGIKKRE